MTAMITPEYLLNFNISDRSQFIKKLVLCPIVESSEHLKQIENINDMGENKITGVIYKYIKNKSSISGAIGRKYITVHYRAKDIVEDKETEPDLELTVFNCFSIKFEAKRIYSRGYAEYCGEGGLECFLSGYYSYDDEIGGMLAYVQRDDIFKVKEEIIERVKNKECINVIDAFFVDLSFLSTHKRKELNNTIDIYHILLDLSNNCTN